MVRAIVLLSGGIDSATTLALARSQRFDVTALIFRYGQRHIHETKLAEQIVKANDISDHVIVDIDLRSFGQSCLTDEIAVPKRRTLEEMSASIPDSYVPARNSIFLTYAMALAEVRESQDIFLGVNALDYGGYPDCRPEYIAAFEAMANLATKASVGLGRSFKIHTPLIYFSKADIIKTGLELGVDYGITSSCYIPSVDGLACGECDACILRLQGFQECDTDDPIAYELNVRK